MSDMQDFPELLRRLKAGDEEAAARLVQQYEPEIRQVIRARMGKVLSSLYESGDIWQSVAVDLFEGIRSGKYDLHDTQHLIRLLVTMVKNKLTDKARHHRRIKRDWRRVDPAGDEKLEALVDPHPSLSRVSANKELLEQVRRRLSKREQQIFDLRAAGQEWEAIAVQLGDSAEAVRKQLSRAIERIRRQGNIEEESS